MSIYAKRGYACSSITSALTSNRKFLPPDASVYNLQHTYMMRYPGYSGDFITNIKNPDNVLKEHPPDHSESPPIEKSCPGCHKLYGST